MTSKDTCNSRKEGAAVSIDIPSPWTSPTSLFLSLPRLRISSQFYRYSIFIYSFLKTQNYHVRQHGTHGVGSRPSAPETRHSHHHRAVLYQGAEETVGTQ